jgi:hypothetical protein
LKRASLLVCVLGVLTSCAHYSTSASGAGGSSSVAVPMFDNKSLESGLQQALTDSLIQGFVSNGALRVLDEDRAHLVLRGEILEVREEPFTYSGGDEQFRISIFLEISCYDSQEKKPLWEESGLRGFGIFDAAQDRQEARTNGLNDAIRMLVEDVVDRTQVGGW